MKNGVLMGGLVVLMIFCVVTYADANRDFKIINSTGYPIKYISINQPGENAWGENEISAVLKDKEGFEMSFEGEKKGCSWNMKVIWADNNAASIYSGLDLCKVKVLTLKYDRKTDTPAFSTE
jgi:hypothetical protein